MNTKLFKLLTAGTFALLSACGDTVVDESGDSAPVQTKATLNVLVRNASTGVPLRASVKLLSTGAADSTNAATGTLSFNDISVGEHRVLIEKTGYASMVSPATISTSAPPTENIFIAGEYTVNASLMPLTSSLDGYVYYEDANGISKPAEGAIVRVELTNTNLADRIFTATVGADGKFAFPELPAVGNGYNLQILEITKEGQTYKANTPTITLESLRDGLPAHITNSIKYKLTDLVSLFELMSYKTIIGKTETLSLEFSDAIDPAKLTPDVVYSEYNNIPTDKELSADNKTLQLVPLGTWPSGDFRVCFGSLKALNGKTVTGSSCTGMITVEAEPLAAVQVTGLALNKDDNLDTDIDFNTSGVSLIWGKVAGATGYRLYARASAGNKKEEFIRIDRYITDTTATVYYYDFNLGSNNAFANGNSVEFVVQAYNQQSETKLNGATALTVKDKKKPTWNIGWTQAGSDSVAQWYGSYPYIDNSCFGGYDEFDSPIYYSCESGTNNGFISAFKFDKLRLATGYSYSTVSITFSEPMDTLSTTITIAPDEPASAPARFSVGKEWSDNRRILYLTPSIAAGTVSKAESKFRVQVKNLQDIAGNKFEEEYTLSGNRKKKTNDLEFRFHHLATP
jgi:hypothetical protein